jgi:hypothetical protein
MAHMSSPENPALLCIKSTKTNIHLSFISAKAIARMCPSLKYFIQQTLWLFQNAYGKNYFDETQSSYGTDTKGMAVKKLCMKMC